MKIPYWDTVQSYFGKFTRGGGSGSGGSGTESTDSIASLQQPEEVTVAYASQIHNYIQRNGPTDASEKFDKAKPFLFLSLLMWPTYWTYRGFDWPNQRKFQTLQVYINRTYAQAKLLQVCILVCSILAAGVKPRSSRILNVNK